MNLTTVSARAQLLACICSRHLFELVKTRAKGPDKNAKAKAEILPRSSWNVSCHKGVRAVPKGATRFIVESEPTNAFYRHRRIV